MWFLLLQVEVSGSGALGTQEQDREAIRKGQRRILDPCHALERTRGGSSRLGTSHFHSLIGRSILLRVLYCSTCGVPINIRASALPVESAFENPLRYVHVHDDVNLALRLENIADRETFTVLCSSERSSRRSSRNSTLTRLFFFLSTARVS